MPKHENDTIVNNSNFAIIYWFILPFVKFRCFHSVFSKKPHLVYVKNREKLPLYSRLDRISFVAEVD